MLYIANKKGYYVSARMIYSVSITRELIDSQTGVSIWLFCR